MHAIDDKQIIPTGRRRPLANLRLNSREPSLSPVRQRRQTTTPVSPREDLGQCRKPSSIDTSPPITKTHQHCHSKYTDKSTSTSSDVSKWKTVQKSSVTILPTSPRGGNSHHTAGDTADKTQIGRSANEDVNSRSLHDAERRKLRHSMTSDRQVSGQTRVDKDQSSRRCVSTSSCTTADIDSQTPGHGVRCRSTLLSDGCCVSPMSFNCNSWSDYTRDTVIQVRYDDIFDTATFIYDLLPGALIYTRPT